MSESKKNLLTSIHHKLDEILGTDMNIFKTDLEGLKNDVLLLKELTEPKQTQNVNNSAFAALQNLEGEAPPLKEEALELEI